MQPTNTLRFESFSDGVFAIAVTLLALELRVPYLQNGSWRLSLQGLIPLVPSLLTFVLSFLAIAIFWVNHHQLTQTITTINRRRILWLNMLLLLFVTLIPFVTQTMSVNAPAPVAVSMYAFVLFGASASFSLLRYWVHKAAGDSMVFMNRSFVGPTIYFFAILAPMFFVPLAYVLLAIPPLFYFLPKSSVSL
jgi:uncharacterized membrane protein